LGRDTALSAVDSLPPVRLTRRERALAETASTQFGEIVAEALAELRTLVERTGPASEALPVAPYQMIAYGDASSTGEALYTVSGVRVFEPLSVMVRLSTSAVIADRTVAVEYRTASGTRWVVAGTQAAVQASTTQSFCWYVGAGDVAWPVEDAAIAPLPHQFLAWDQAVAVKVWNAQAGDVLDNFVIAAMVHPSEFTGDT
jgi:hypothetical protein